MTIICGKCGVQTRVIACFGDGKKVLRQRLCPVCRGLSYTMEYVDNGAEEKWREMSREARKKWKDERDGRLRV